MASTPKIQCLDLHKSFSGKEVLHGIDLTVGRGESLVVIGGSGTGKSVMLKCILGLIHPDQGQVLIDGTDTVALRGAARVELMKKFGMLFQGGALFDSLKIWENITFGLVQTHRVTRREARDIAVQKLADVGLRPEVGELLPVELSGGMQKRVALARAIAMEPEILFFDEPTTGLDPIMSDVINKLIVKCVKELGASAISITHDMASARTIADRIAMIHDGRIVWSGPAADVNASGNALVDQFVNGRAEGPIEMRVHRD